MVAGEDEHGSRPVPDPTVLTTEALHREISALRELVLERVDRVTEVADEKFDSIETQLDLIERQRVEQKKDTKDAVDAALAAAKEAVKEQTTASERAIAKSEAATTKSIDQLGVTFTTAIDGSRRESADLKERVVAAEQQKVGGQEARTVAQETRAGLSSVAQLGIAAFVAFLVLAALVVSIVVATSTP